MKPDDSRLYAPVVQLLVERNPRRVIDISPRWGKYGLACREYLTDLQTLHAVGPKEHSTPPQQAIYDWVYFGDPRDSAYNTRFWARWDTAIFVDGLDDLDRDTGHLLFAKLLDADLYLIIGAPLTSDWFWESFDRYTIDADASSAATRVLGLAP